MHNYGYCSTVGTTRYNAIRHAILRCAQKLTSQLIYRTRPKLESGKNYTTDNNISSLFVTEYRGRVPWWGVRRGGGHTCSSRDGRAFTGRAVSFVSQSIDVRTSRPDQCRSARVRYRIFVPRTFPRSAENYHRARIYNYRVRV